MAIPLTMLATVTVTVLLIIVLRSASKLNDRSQSCALGFARSGCLIAGGVVGVAELVLDRAEHAE